MTCVVAMPSIQPAIRKNMRELRLQFVRVEPHCHSLFGTAEDGMNITRGRNTNG